MARVSLGTAPLTVACVLRRGGLFWGSREGPFFAKYVRILRDAVAAQLSLPHRFVCLSDVAVSCERIDLHQFWPGAWAKIELFRPGVTSVWPPSTSRSCAATRSISTVSGWDAGRTVDQRST